MLWISHEYNIKKRIATCKQCTDALFIGALGEQVDIYSIVIL